MHCTVDVYYLYYVWSLYCHQQVLSLPGNDQVGAVRRAIARVPTLSTLSVDQTHISHMRQSRPVWHYLHLGDNEDNILGVLDPYCNN